MVNKDSLLSLSGMELLSKEDARFFKKKARELVLLLGLQDRLLSVHFCDDLEIKELNKRFRKKSKATDVLSFEISESDDDPFANDVLGDIVISIETARRQSHDAGHALKFELCVLLAHGVLHLLGFDHELSSSEARKQAEAELFLLSSIDVPVEIALISRHLI